MSTLAPSPPAEELDLSPEDEALLDRINDDIGEKIRRGDLQPLPPLPERADRFPAQSTPAQ
jgi:hypothetical protein